LCFFSILYEAVGFCISVVLLGYELNLIINFSFLYIRIGSNLSALCVCLIQFVFLAVRCPSHLHNCTSNVSFLSLCRNVDSTPRWEFAAVCRHTSTQCLTRHFRTCCVTLSTSAVLSVVNLAQVGAAVALSYRIVLTEIQLHMLA